VPTTTSLRRLALLFMSLASPAAAAFPEGLCPVQPATIAVVGDSLADGLWGAIYRSFMECKTVSVLRVTTVSDGLTRTSPEDWAQRIGDALDQRLAADVVLVQVGANDIRPIRNGSTRALFADPAWDAAYGERTRTLAEQLADRTKKLIWLGLPIVGDEGLEEDYRHITKLQQTAVGGVREAYFVDIHQGTKFGSESFTPNGDVNGELRQLRASDQIHFTDIGYNMVLSIVSDDIVAVLKAKDADADLDSLVLQ